MQKLQNDGNKELINNPASLAVLFSEKGHYSRYSDSPWWVTMGDIDFMCDLWRAFLFLLFGVEDAQNIYPFSEENLCSA